MPKSKRARSPGRPLIHGKRSQFLPARLADRYQQALDDSELSSQRRHLAVLASMIQSKCESLSEVTSAAHIRRAIKALQGSYKVPPNICEAIVILEDALSEAAAEQDIRAAILEFAKVSDTEHRRIATIGAIVTAEQQMALMARLINFITTEPGITDDARRRLSRGLIEMTEIEAKHPSQLAPRSVT